MADKTKTLKLSSIQIDSGVQPRAKGIDESTVEKYREDIENGDEFPPLVVYQEGKTFWLSEGFHRAEAFSRASVKEISCVVRPGGRREARLNACGSNSTHGLPRSNADKRRAVEMVLEDYPSWSNPRIAKHAAVSVEFVRKIRPVNDGEVRETSDGKKRPPIIRHVSDCPATVAGQSDTDDNVLSATVADRNMEITEEIAKNEPEPPLPDPECKTKNESLSETISLVSDSPPPAAKVILPPVVDAWGIPIQTHAVDAFATVPKFKQLVAAIQAAQKLFNEVTTSPGGEFLRLPSASSFRRGKRNGDDYADRYVHTGLEQALQHVKAAVPKHTVCPYQYAEAPHPDDCRTCLNLKWTPELSSSVPPVCIDRAKIAFGANDKEAA